MALLDPLVPDDATRVLETHVALSFQTLCQVSEASPEHVLALVREGLMQPFGAHPLEWRFDGDALARTRKALRLARDLELDVPAVVLVMHLLDEVDRLRACMRSPAARGLAAVSAPGGHRAGSPD